ncbi:MAG: hypothetical protein ACK56I_03885, partial [bacterium]
PQHEPLSQVLDHRGLPLAPRGQLHYPRPDHHPLTLLLLGLERKDGDLPGLRCPAYRRGDHFWLCREQLHIHVLQPALVQYGVFLFIVKQDRNPFIYCLLRPRV